MRPVVCLLLLCLCALAEARKPRHSRTDPSILRSQTPKIQEPPPITGLLEMRPTWGTQKKRFTTENYYEMSFWTGSRERITVGETLFTSPGQNQSQDVFFGDGFVRYQWREVSKNPRTGLAVTTDVRANLPLSKNSREAGLITALRSTVLMTVPITPNTRFEFRETPILYVFKEAGHESATGSLAHPIFENRVSLGPVISLSSSLTLVVPLYFSLMQYRRYQKGAFHDGELVPDLSFSPEIDWQVNSNLYLGLSYRTDGLIVRDDMGLVLSETAGSGSIQFVMGVSF